MLRITIILLFFVSPQQFFSEELFGENLIFSPPNGYHIGYTNRKNNIFLQEWVPNGQKVNNWSEMISVQVLFDYKTSDLEDFVDDFIKIIVDVCVDGRGLTVTKGKENGYFFHLFITICGVNPNTQKHEFTMVKTILGTDALYIIQKAWKYKPTNSQIQDWSKAFSKVFICDTRNETAPCPNFK